MAQLTFQAVSLALLNLSPTIPKALPVRWQHQAKESGGRGRSPSRGTAPMMPASRSHGCSETVPSTAGESGFWIQRKATSAGPDRYIPNRSTMRMELANFLLTKEKDPAEESPAKKVSMWLSYTDYKKETVYSVKWVCDADGPNHRCFRPWASGAWDEEHRKAWAVNVNGFDPEEAKILRLSGKPRNAAAGSQKNLEVLCSQRMMGGCRRRNAKSIPSTPERVLDAPDILDDYYLNLLDWSAQDVLAVALDTSVYLWHRTSGEIIKLMEVERVADYVSCVSWGGDGRYLAVGTSNAEVQLWNVEQQKLLRTMSSHSSRVGCLSWNSSTLSSGARSGHIHHHDVRVAEHHVATLAGHTQQVCGLQWSLDGRYLASGGDDNLVNIWPRSGGGGGELAPVQTFRQHQGAVKAVAWCPWQSNVVATGGGTGDRHIRIWNVRSGTCLGAVDARSQVCSILWSASYKELISGHGSAQNQLVIWKYPTLAKVTELQGHTGRVLSMAMSPDGATVASAAADETLRLWRCFELDPIRKKEREKAARGESSVLRQRIR